MPRDGQLRWWPEKSPPLTLSSERRSWRRSRTASGPPRGIRRNVLVGVEIVVVRVIVEPLVVAHVAIATTMDRSPEPAHPLVDQEGRVFAHVGDDGRLAGAKNPPGLVAR